MSVNEAFWTGLPLLSRLPAAADVRAVLQCDTGTSSGGFPYLQQAAFERFRDQVPHLFGAGATLWTALEPVDAALAELPKGEAQGMERALRVVRTMLNTAAVTAPPDLWLLRYVLSTMHEVGLLQRMAEGEVIRPEQCDLHVGGRRVPTVATELRIDLSFLTSRGYLDTDGDAFTLQPQWRNLATLPPLPPRLPSSLAEVWRSVWRGEALTGAARSVLELLYRDPPKASVDRRTSWAATPDEIVLGHLIVPVVLGLRAAALKPPFATQGDALRRLGLQCLERAGWLREENKDTWAATALGSRALSRGPGPFGIIEAYHPYTESLPLIWQYGRGSVRVSRGANVAASQDANSATFQQANDALDAFAKAYDFKYRVFIEHAVGCGEATRQRYERMGDALVYVGADLEDAAIDAADAQRAAGKLPSHMVFVRRADIGVPETLLAALRARNIPSRDAVMIVGNGFHEVRQQTDAKMIEVFAAYEQAGIVVFFTEESALSVDDLLATAWNTYHAGFKYVHERSGQGLRPADPVPPPRRGPPLPASWKECAAAAGYVRLEQFCSRSRTIYPYAPASGYNPSISMNHMVIPRELAERLKLFH